MFEYGYYTDKGRVKAVNQDSLLIMEAETDRGNVLFAAVCDGMGGLSKGEDASFMMISALEKWFSEDLPSVVYGDDGVTTLSFRRSMIKTVHATCDEIGVYAESISADCGTTLSGLLITDTDWFVVNVGDTRVYAVTDNGLRLITKDQSFVQREIDEGRMTEEEAKTHKMRSMLLQCIGASDVVIPDWYTGAMKDDAAFLLCSDGFRHVYSSDELYEALKSAKTKEEIEESLKTVAEESMKKGERDNITAIVIRRCDHA